MNHLKHNILLIVILILLGVGVYLFFTDFQILKKIFGDSLPIATSTPPVGPSGEVDFLTHSQDLSISVFASGLTGPRVIAFDSRGRMLVSETKAGRVVLLEDTDKDGLAETKTVLREDLRSPHGLAFYTDPKTKKVYLYIAETHQVSRFEYDASKGIVISASGKNIASLPADGQHFTRSISFGPNYRPVPILGGASTIDTQVKDKLYISIGSSCDACVEDTWKRAAILESDPEGNYTAEFAGGLRSAEFFTFHPETKEIWASEIGRDGLGANLPPDEINIIKVATSEHQYGARRYGWPFCYGNQVKDSTFQPDKVDRIDIPTDCGQSEPATIEIPAHSSPLGLAFITSDKWPKEWRNNLLVAYHGQIGNSTGRGYKIVRLDVDKNGQSGDTHDFITGWLVPSEVEGLSLDNKVFGQPVDLKFGPDGALYISDDAAGIIYRVTASI